MAADAEGSSTVKARPSAVDGPHGATSAASAVWRGPGWRVFDASPGHGKHVRDWVVGVVAGHGCPLDPTDVALVVSELFTNALVHGPAGGQVLVGYCLWADGARIVVCDGGGATTPRMRDAGGMEEGGRGLQVVDAVAAAWGSFRVGHTQAVWCDLEKPLDAPIIEAFAWLRALLAVIDLAAPRSAAVGQSPGIESGEPAAARRRQVVRITFADWPSLGSQLLSLHELARTTTSWQAPLPPPHSGQMNEPGPGDGTHLLVEAGPPWRRIARAAMVRRRLFVVDGVVTAGAAAGSGLAWAIAGQPDAFLVLAAAAVLALVIGTLDATAAMYEARQEPAARRSNASPRTPLRPRWPDALMTPMSRRRTCPALKGSRK